MKSPSSLQEELHKKHPFEVREQEAYLSLKRTSSMLDADFERFYRAYGLSIATYNALRILRGAGERGRMCHEIRDHMVAQVPDITRLVDRLEEAGLATRARCNSDRRVVYCHITPKGLDLLAQLDEPVKERHRCQLSHLSHEELESLIRLLLKARHPPIPVDLCP
jgi:DNA-binding MarR family transcriptional regulator